MAVIQTDKSLQETVTVSGSSAVYSTGFDIGDASRVTNGKVKIAMDTDWTSGNHVVSLIADTALPLDGSSVVISTLPSYAADSLDFFTLPQNKEYQYWGISLTAVAHTSSIDLHCFEMEN